jgi:hypothetical protein
VKFITQNVQAPFVKSREKHKSKIISMLFDMQIVSFEQMQLA